MRSAEYGGKLIESWLLGHPQGSWLFQTGDSGIQTLCAVCVFPMGFPDRYKGFHGDHFHPELQPLVELLITLVKHIKLNYD